MEAGKKIIEAQDLKKTYQVTDIFEMLKGKKKVVGVSEASFYVNEGEIFSIIGINGAGKTTIMKCILGLIKPDAGSIKVFGKNKIEREDYYNIGYLPEISYYPKEVKLKTLINYYADLYNMKQEVRKKVIPEILEILKLDGRENDRIEKFSKGMLQRVGIAQAIMNSPKLLFLDEPMTGLDPVGQKLVADIIRKLKENGTTIILNTHVLSDVSKLSDRIAVVDKGKVGKIINFKEFIKDTGKYTVETDKNFGKGILQNGVYHVHVEEKDLDSTIKEIHKEGVKVISIKKEEMTLEKFFLDEIS